jgi:hypothetical protein
MITENRNELWDKKCSEMQTYLGSKKSSGSWKFIKNIWSSNSNKSQLNLISADSWGKYYYKLLIENRKRFLGENENVSEKYIDSIIEIDINTVKQTIMRMKNGRPRRHPYRVD